MDYTETEASRMLKKYNDILYETLRKAKGDVRDSFQQTLSTINQAIDDYAHKRAKEQKRLQQKELSQLRYLMVEL